MAWPSLLTAGDYGGFVAGSQGRGGEEITRAITSRGQPMSPTVTTPKYRRASALTNPTFSATKVTVRAARTQTGPSGRPVSQSNPLGTSTANTGRRDAFTAAARVGNGSRGASLRPVPKIASISRTASV